MSIFNWINKWLGTEHSKSNLPPEFELSNENVNDSIINTTRTNNLSDDSFDSFEETITNLLMSNLETLFKQIDLEFPFGNEDNTNILIGDAIDQPSIGEEYNKIPKKNFVVRNYFLNTGSTPRTTLSESPVRNVTSPEFNVRQANSNSYYFGQWNGRRIEKQVSSKQLPDGISQKVIVLKDGDQKCVTTMEFLSGNQLSCKKELYNLNESQLDEFEKRFSKFR